MTQELEIIVDEGRKDIPKVLHPACQKCIKNSRDKYSSFTSDDGTYYPNGFATECKYIPPDENYIPESLRDGDIPEEILSQINSLRSPLLWAETYLNDPDSGRPWKAWPHQRAPLLCSSSRIVYRFGRRTGKSTILAINTIWSAVTSCGGQIKDDETGKVKRNLKILFLAPYKSQVDNVFDRIKEFIAASPELDGCVTRSVRGSPQRISLGDSTITGFASGDSSGSSGKAVRGQDADIVIVDEAAYVSEQVMMAVVNPILYTNSHTRLVISSTPSGIANDYFEKTCTTRPDFAEFYVPASARPDWDEVEPKIRKDFGSDKERWNLEVEARFAPSGIGIYRDDLVRQAQQEYDYGSLKYNSSLIYTIGVDWNKKHGTEIVIVGTQRAEPHISYVVWAENIPKEEFTTPMGVHRIVELNRIWFPDWIFVDAGGSDGGSYLRHYGRSVAGKHVVDARLMSNVVTFDFGKSLEIQEFNGNKTKVPAKPFLVGNSVQRFELGQIKYPSSDLTITKQLNVYIEARRTQQGIPVYGLSEPKWGDHRLDALNLALVALKLKFPSFYQADISAIGASVAYNPDMTLHTKMEHRVIVPASTTPHTRTAKAGRSWRRARKPFLGRGRVRRRMGGF